MVPRSHKKNTVNLLSMVRSVLGIVVLLILVYYVGVHNLFKSISSIKLFYLPLILSLYIIFLLISALCIKVLIKGKNIPFSKLFKYYSLSWVVGLLLPGKLGEFSLVYFLKKEGIKTIHAVVISLLDKFLTLLFLLCITFYGFFLFFTIRQSVIFISVLCIIFLFSYIFEKYIDSFLFIIPTRFRKHIKNFFYQYHLFIKNGKKGIYINFLLTIVRWLVNSLVVFFIFLSLGLHVNIFYILIVNTMAALVSLIPITINGLGIRQSVGVFLFSKINVSPVITVNMYIINLSLTYLIALSLYSYYTYIQRGVQ